MKRQMLFFSVRESSFHFFCTANPPREITAATAAITPKSKVFASFRHLIELLVNGSSLRAGHDRFGDPDNIVGRGWHVDLHVHALVVTRSVRVGLIIRDGQNHPSEHGAPQSFRSPLPGIRAREAAVFGSEEETLRKLRQQRDGEAGGRARHQRDPRAGKAVLPHQLRKHDRVQTAGKGAEDQNDQPHLRRQKEHGGHPDKDRDPHEAQGGDDVEVPVPL